MPLRLSEAALRRLAWLSAASGSRGWHSSAPRRGLGCWEMLLEGDTQGPLAKSGDHNGAGGSSDKQHKTSRLSVSPG